MKITIIAIGKLKERFFSEAAAEYAKRLGKYAEVSVVELADEKEASAPSVAEIAITKSKEGERVKQRLAQFAHNAFVIALSVEGKQETSESFARLLSEQTDLSKRLVFVIGGSHGLSGEVLSLCHARLSFSKMTFPHQLFRVVLLEQIYRACKINRNEPYHK